MQTFLNDCGEVARTRKRTNKRQSKLMIVGRIAETKGLKEERTGGMRDLTGGKTGETRGQIGGKTGGMSV